MKNKPSRKKYVRKFSIDRKNTITRKKYAGYNPNTRLPPDIEYVICKDKDNKVTRNSHWNNPTRHLDLKMNPQIKKCKVLYTNENFYQGIFDTLKNIKIGHGIMNYINGDNYNGDWKNNNKEGSGVMMYHTGDTYIGKWKNDLKNGVGRMSYGENSEIVEYEGNWKNDLKHGKGKITYNNGDGVPIYGEWENDIMIPTKSRKTRKSTTQKTRISTTETK